MKIHGGLMEKLYSIASELAPLVAEFGNDGVAAALGIGSETDKTAKGLARANGDGAGGGANGGAPVDPMKRFEESLASMRTDLDKIAKSRNPSNAEVPRDGAGKPPEHRIPYGKDLSVIIREEQAKGAATRT
jgi:hypothetical protein